MKFYPSVNEFIGYSKNYNLIPVYCEIFADTETPVSTFMKLTRGASYSFLLESVEGGERWGRYSFISWDPQKIFSIKGNEFTVSNSSGRVVKKGILPDPLAELENIMSAYRQAPVNGLPRFVGGAVGFAGYETIRYFENISPAKRDIFNIVDAIFLINDLIVVFDHLTHTTKIVSCAETGAGTRNAKKKYREACKKIAFAVKRLGGQINTRRSVNKTTGIQTIVSNTSKIRFIAMVKKAKEYIRNGDIIQVVLSQRFSKRTPAKPFDIYRALRNVNPSPYMYYMNMKDFQIVGSSPEILVRKDSLLAEIMPIAGTRPRGATPEEERKFEKELLNSVKEAAEHIMLVDLGRNDLGRVCSSASVKTSALMKVEKYSHVMHMVSSVTGALKKGINAFDLFRACFPAGTVSGAPKIRAMEIISELEPETRGTYAGAVGYFSYSGNMDMAITIRTIFYKNGTAYVQAGAGIVADSIPEKEFEESRNKAKALFKAIEIAEEGLQ